MEVNRTSKVLGGLVVAALFATSCGLGSDDGTASVRVEPADGASPAATLTDQDGVDDLVDDALSNGLSDQANDDQANDDQANSDQASGLGAGIAVERYSVPYVPPIRLPDLSVLSETGTIVEGALGEFATEESGLDVLGAQCAADGGELVYNGSDRSESFFDIESDGSGTYESAIGADDIVDITIESDGSGTYSNIGGEGKNVKITVNSDGSGSYRQVGGEESIITIEVAADGSGNYSSNGNGVVNIAINGDGSGSYKNVGGELGAVINLDVNADQTGTFTSTGTPDGVIRIEVGADGSRFYKQTGGDVGVVEMLVNADGSGNYKRVGDGNNVTITVDSNGSGTYKSVGNGIVDTTFTTDIGILDPQLLVIDSEPTFAVADRFPPLAKLGALKPPCATIIRLDASVLFDFDSDELRKEATPVVDKVAAALIANNKSIEVHGHTDSKGDDAYNQDLSDRRAASFAAALVSSGVTTDIETIGYGESRPVAPNETATGEDDPTGRQLNRRIEIVIPE